MSETEPHRVTWRDGVATFHCDGNRNSACHSFPDCECEEGSAADHNDHPNVPHDACWVLSWLEVTDAEDGWFDGGALLPTMPKVDGPIETEWEGDYMSWCYAESDELAAQLNASAPPPGPSAPPSLQGKWDPVG